mmetsp:Transcript_19085/g.47177  ORF Transcript_19085/g.47177 Transcript_19085/m.47177 type:complete len:136 (-) Transcript_19085:397-804(-)
MILNYAQDSINLTTCLAVGAVGEIDLGTPICHPRCSIIDNDDDYEEKEEDLEDAVHHQYHPWLLLCLELMICPMAHKRRTVTSLPRWCLAKKGTGKRLDARRCSNAGYSTASGSISGCGQGGVAWIVSCQLGTSG